MKKNNLFNRAKFGKKYITRNEREVVFIRFQRDLAIVINEEDREYTVHLNGRVLDTTITADDITKSALSDKAKTDYEKFKEKRRAQAREYYAKNREKRKQQMKERYEERKNDIDFKIKRSEITKKYYQKNKERIRAQYAERKNNNDK